MQHDKLCTYYKLNDSCLLMQLVQLNAVKNRTEKCDSQVLNCHLKLVVQSEILTIHIIKYQYIETFHFHGTILVWNSNLQT